MQAGKYVTHKNGARTSVRVCVRCGLKSAVLYVCLQTFNTLGPAVQVTAV